MTARSVDESAVAEKKAVPAGGPFFVSREAAKKGQNSIASPAPLRLRAFG